MDEEQLRQLIPFLLQAQQGSMGGINPMGAANFNPEVVDLMGDAQGFDAEDERIARQRAIADELRQGSPNGGVDPRATSSKAMWAGALANIGKSALGAYQNSKADTRQVEADRKRRIGNRNMYAARGGIAPMTSTRDPLPMQQPDLSGIQPPRQRSF